MIGERLGAYRVEERLGGGGMGEVYLARAEEADGGVEAGAPVALKVLHPRLLADPTYLGRFRREVTLGLRVRHGNVVRVLASGTDRMQGLPVAYLVMALVEGETLRAVLDREKTLPEARVRRIGADTADGLAAIHAEGIVHRDLKPDNLFVTPDGGVCIMDLGVARSETGADVVSLPGQFVGSLEYASPEQLRGYPPEAASDQYGLGISLYEAVSGRQPFSSDNSQAVVVAHLRHVPPPLAVEAPGTSPFLSALVETLLAKKPSERFPSAAALAEALRAGEAGAWWRARAGRP